MEKIVVILGPTSSGKTSLAIDLCKKYNGEIISADSRQVYKYMDIGTGKTPINKDIGGVKIHGYDLVEPDKFFSAYDFAQFALKTARELLEAEKQVFLVGGTGFYIDLFVGNKKPAGVEPDFKLRKTLENLSLDELQKELTSLNPEALTSIDKNNPARLIRAIEIEKNKHLSPTSLPYLENVEFEFFGLTADRKILYARADKWLETIWGEKLFDEVRNLIDLGFSDSKPMNGLIYSTVKDYLSKEISEQDAKDRCKFDLHSYIRRQQTYFNKMSDAMPTGRQVSWLDISKDNFALELENAVESR